MLDAYLETRKQLGVGGESREMLMLRQVDTNS